MDLSVNSNQAATSSTFAKYLSSLNLNSSATPAPPKEATKVQVTVDKTSGQQELIGSQPSTLQTIIQTLIKGPSVALQGAQTVVQNISELSESARSQRQADSKVGKGVVSGAKDFSSEVRGFYEFLSKIEASKLNRDEIVNHLGGLAQQYTQKQAGVQIVSAAQELFPQSYSELSSVLTAKPTTGTPSFSNTSVQVLPLPAATLGSFGGKVLGWAGAAYSIYEISKGKLDPSSAALSGAAAGAYIGSAILPGVGTAIGAVLGGVGGFLSGMFRTGKPKDQQERDAVRKQLMAAGVLDSNWNISMANAATFDIGKDGGAKLQNKNGGLRPYKELDPSNPLSQPISQIAAPLAKAISAGNQRLANEFTAYLTNAAISNSNTVEGALQNLQAIYAKFGVPIEKVLQGVSNKL